MTISSTYHRCFQAMFTACALAMFVLAAAPVWAVLPYYDADVHGSVSNAAGFNEVGGGTGPVTYEGELGWTYPPVGNVLAFGDQKPYGSNGLGNGTTGWVAKARLNVVSSTGNQLFRATDGLDQWGISFKDDNVRYMDENEVQQTLAAVPSGWHDYSIQWDPATAQTTYRLDGEVIGTLVRADVANAATSVAWNDVFGSNTSGPFVDTEIYINHLSLGTAAPNVEDVTDFIWNVGSGGDWTSPGSWTFGGPPGLDPEKNANHTVTFGDKITANSTVFSDSDLSVRAITFLNSATYNVAGNGNLSLVRGTTAGSPDPSIAVGLGNHQFQINVALQDNTTASMASGSTLEFNNRLFLNGHTLSKAGPGTIAINNDIVSGGGTVDILQGTVTGVGTIGGDLNNSGGTISPGSSSGQATSFVPEPASWVMLGLGLLGWLAMSKRRVQLSVDKHIDGSVSR